MPKDEESQTKSMKLGIVGKYNEIVGDQRVEPRQTAETQTADQQCVQSIKDLNKECKLWPNGPNNTCTKCYICGFSISGADPPNGGKQPGNHAGYQCEHVLPVMEIALLCGLGADRKGGDACTAIPSIKTSFCAYNESIRELFETILKPDDSIRELYNKYRTALLQGTRNSEKPPVQEGSVYQWSHPTCNLIKNIRIFIDIDFDALAGDRASNRISVKDEIVESNIYYVLDRLTGYGKTMKSSDDKWLGDGNGWYQSKTLV